MKNFFLILFVFTTITLIYPLKGQNTCNYLWLEGKIKNELIEVENHGKSKSSVIAHLLNVPKALIFQSSVTDFSQWFFILEASEYLAIVEKMKYDEIFDWNIFEFDLKKNKLIKESETCEMKDYFLTNFYVHITKETVRHLSKSHEYHQRFINSIEEKYDFIFTGGLNRGNEGYVYFTKNKVISKEIIKHKGLETGFFIVEQFKVKFCEP